MKWAALFIILATILPLSRWLRRNPGQAPKIWMLMGFLPFVLFPLHLLMAVISHNFWPGYVRGAEVTVLDALAVAFYINLPDSRQRLPFLFPMMLYFFAVLLSAVLAASPTDALFYPWQLARMFLVYATVVRGCADPRVAPALLKGMAAGLLMEAALIIWQRVGLGIVLADGTFHGHNYVGLISHYIVFPNLALALAGQSGRLTGATVVAGIIIEVLTTSRATIALAGSGFAILFMISALRQWTSRKMRLLFIGLGAIAVLAPLAIASFEHRFAAEESLGIAEFDERAAFERSSAMILSDYPLGTGPNHYAVVAGLQGYNLRAGVPQVAGENDAFVHNVYWLVAAETGYPGVITFVIFLLCPLTVAFRCGWLNRRDRRGDLLLGLGVALLVVYIHCFYEWVFVGSEGQYIFAMNVGLVAGLAGQLGYWQQTRRRTFGMETSRGQPVRFDNTRRDPKAGA